jgi:hypothetical protein
MLEGCKPFEGNYRFIVWGPKYDWLGKSHSYDVRIAERDKDNGDEW